MTNSFNPRQEVEGPPVLAGYGQYYPPLRRGHAGWLEQKGGGVVYNIQIKLQVIV